MEGKEHKSDAAAVGTGEGASSSLHAAGPTSDEQAWISAGTPESGAEFAANCSPNPLHPAWRSLWKSTAGCVGWGAGAPCLSVCQWQCRIQARRSHKGQSAEEKDTHNDGVWRGAHVELQRERWLGVNGDSTSEHNSQGERRNPAAMSIGHASCQPLRLHDEPRHTCRPLCESTDTCCPRMSRCHPPPHKAGPAPHNHDNGPHGPVPPSSLSPVPPPLLVLCAFPVVSTPSVVHPV
jgi:hypothetical protein